MVYVGQVQDPKYIDKTWAGFNGYVTGIVEGTVGIMCACAPSLRRFLGVWFRGQMRSTGSGTPKTPSSGDSAAKQSVRSERAGDADRYPGNGGGGAGAIIHDIKSGEFEFKSPYVIEERATQPETVAMSPGLITTKQKERAAAASGRSFYFDTSVVEPELGEDDNDIP
jgi:hypothetical protein